MVKTCHGLLKPGDVVILTTPLAFRWVHFGYAIKKAERLHGKASDRRWPDFPGMMSLAEQASAKEPEVGVRSNVPSQPRA